MRGLGVAPPKALHLRGGREGNGVAATQAMAGNDLGDDVRQGCVEIDQCDFGALLTLPVVVQVSLRPVARGLRTPDRQFGIIN